jgi:hypothetical protein
MYDTKSLKSLNWLKNNQVSEMRFPIILPEYKCYANSIPDVIGMNHHHTAVIECKISRADYLSDSKKGHRHYLFQLGNYRYYLVPVGLISSSEVNGGWGLLYCHPYKITIEKESDYFPIEQTRPQEYQVMYSIIRRLTSFDGHDKTLEILRFGTSLPAPSRGETGEK